MNALVLTCVAANRRPSRLCHVRRYAPTMFAAQPDIEAESLGRRFAAGQAGLREVYDEYAGLVFGICRRTLDGEAAKDVTQEVFVSAWKGRAQFDPSRGALAAWLVGITKRRVIDHVRRHARHDDHRAALPDGDLAAVGDADVDEIADKMLVAHALRQLPERAREMVSLAYLHDLTHDQIATRTGVPLGTVKSDIRRGLVRIRNSIRGAGEY